MSISRSKEVFKDLYNQLEEIQSSLHDSGRSEDVSIQQANNLVRQFLRIESKIADYDQSHIDEVLRKKMVNLIQDIKASPALETMLGTMQAQFFQVLHRIENVVSHEQKGKRVEKVYNEKLDF